MTARQTTVSSPGHHQLRVRRAMALRLPSYHPHRQQQQQQQQRQQRRKTTPLSSADPLRELTAIFTLTAWRETRGAAPAAPSPTARREASVVPRDHPDYRFSLGGLWLSAHECVLSSPAPRDGTLTLVTTSPFAVSHYHRNAPLHHPKCKLLKFTLAPDHPEQPAYDAYMSAREPVSRQRYALLTCCCRDGRTRLTHLHKGALGVFLRHVFSPLHVHEQFLKPTYAAYRVDGQMWMVDFVPLGQDGSLTRVWRHWYLNEEEEDDEDDDREQRQRRRQRQQQQRPSPLVRHLHLECWAWNDRVWLRGSDIHSTAVEVGRDWLSAVRNLGRIKLCLDDPRVERSPFRVEMPLSVRDPDVPTARLLEALADPAHTLRDEPDAAVLTRSYAGVLFRLAPRPVGVEFQRRLGAVTQRFRDFVGALPSRASHTTENKEERREDVSERASREQQQH